MSSSHFGKYRGVVTDNRDPLQMGRIRAKVPDVLGNDIACGWAMPCVQCKCNASRTVGSALPEINAGVWIEFEHGDLNYPIWAGFLWNSTAETPPAYRHQLTLK